MKINPAKEAERLQIEGKRKSMTIKTKQNEMKEEIRQDGQTVLSSEDGFSIPMFFNNLCGKNFSGEEYRDYTRYIAIGEMGFKSREIELYRNGVLVGKGTIPKL